MPDIVWPSLSRTYAVSGIKHRLHVDPTLASELANGRMKTRQLYSKGLHWWTFNLNALILADFFTLEQFHLVTVKVRVTPFVWQHPKTYATFYVRFFKPIEWTTHPQDPDLWNAHIELLEDLGTYGLGYYGYGYYGV